MRSKCWSDTPACQVGITGANPVDRSIEAIGVVDGYGVRSGCNPGVLATKAVRFRPASLMAFFENRIVAAKKRNAGSRIHGEPASRVRRLMAGQRILNPPFEGSIPSAPTSAVVARVAEQRTFNPLGTGSSPVDGTRVRAGLAQRQGHRSSKPARWVRLPYPAPRIFRRRLMARARVFEARCRGSSPRAGTSVSIRGPPMAGEAALTRSMLVRFQPPEPMPASHNGSAAVL